MQPLIFVLPVNQEINSETVKLEYENTPPSPLIKYGFNNISSNLIMMSITTNQYYRFGLELDYWRDADSKLVSKLNFDFNISQTFLEFFELLTLFSVLKTDDVVYVPNFIQELTNVVNIKSFKNIKIISDTKNTKKINLTIIKYSEIDIDENAAVDFISDTINNILPIQTVNSNMIIQLFNIQTQSTVELIHYLTSLYNESYIIKPACVSDIYSTKYLVLMGMKSIKYPILNIEKSSNFLYSLGLNDYHNLETSVKCLNSLILPKKYKLYNTIATYIESSVYEGSTYQNFLDLHQENANSWIKMFIDGDYKLDDIINTTQENCVSINYPLLQFFTEK